MGGIFLIQGVWGSLFLPPGGSDRAEARRGNHRHRAGDARGARQPQAPGARSRRAAATGALESADPAKCRLLFRRVRAKWLWWSRLSIDDVALAAIIHDPPVKLYAFADRAGVEVGLSGDEAPQVPVLE